MESIFTAARKKREEEFGTATSMEKLGEETYWLVTDEVELQTVHGPSIIITLNPVDDQGAIMEKKKVHRCFANIDILTRNKNMAKVEATPYYLAFHGRVKGKKNNNTYFNFDIVSYEEINKRKEEKKSKKDEDNDDDEEEEKPVKKVTKSKAKPKPKAKPKKDEESDEESDEE